MDILIQTFQNHAVVVNNLVLFAVYTASLVFFINGVRAAWQGHRWMRKVPPQQIKAQARKAIHPDDPLVLVVAKSYTASRRKYNNKNPGQASFLADATRQMAENIFQTRYLEPLILSSNLLPPLGFIGTVFGMIMIFIAKVDPSSELNTIGLGAALFTTLLALILFVILETIKLWLSRLIKHRIETGLNLEDVEPANETDQ